MFCRLTNKKSMREYEQIHAFVGLGREPAAEQFRLTLKATTDLERK